MKKALLTIAIVFTIAITSSAYAQTPYFQVYFDENLQEAAANCPAGLIGSHIDTLYVVAHNFNMWISAAEFTIDYTTYLAWLGDFPVGTDLKIGDSQTGIGLAWNIPVNGFGAAVLMTATVAWFCNDCAGISGTPGSEIKLTAYPGQTQPRAVRWPDSIAFEGVGMTSLICPSVPVQETSWGQIKSLYH
jgi:hypothetical protein